MAGAESARGREGEVVTTGSGQGQVVQGLWDPGRLGMLLQGCEILSCGKDKPGSSAPQGVCIWEAEKYQLFLPGDRAREVRLFQSRLLRSCPPFLGKGTVSLDHREQHNKELGVTSKPRAGLR